ncbi:response regulator [Candidatus Cyanaurora vandensis]|uniref:response regulator n=1 Tax=Candidatus Cyanaurora vandensis TaxID=2714958 RepID=UPI0025811ECB|nr:response regulator [Candidatus Cyanaurora vandensis]
MQGKLQETDIKSLLQLAELQKRTGQLFLDVGAGRLWSVFFAQGRLLYATDDREGAIRLSDNLGRLGIGICPVPTVVETAPEYALLTQLIETQQLTPVQATQVIRVLVEEVLFDLLGFTQGSFYLESTAPLAPQWAELEITPLVRLVTARRAEWEKLAPAITSPLEKPVIQSKERLQQQLPAAAFTKLVEWVNGENHLQRVARLLGRDVLTLARALEPYIKEGIITLKAPPVVAPRRVRANTARTRKVVCIDDSISIQKSVELFLQGRGYEVQTIGNPTEALSDLFKSKPDLILLDIAMPRLDGYELCAMIRKSTAFGTTPIVMLTGKDGYIDRVRARIAGATEYLTKPFGEQELLGIVEKYFGPDPLPSLHEVS